MEVLKMSKKNPEVISKQSINNIKLDTNNITEYSMNNIIINQEVNYLQKFMVNRQGILH